MNRVVEGLVPAIPPEHFQPLQRPTKQHVLLKPLPDCVASNITDRSATDNSRCFVVPTAYTDQYKNSCFVKTITRWKQPNESQVHAETAEEFSYLSCGPHSQQIHHQHSPPVIDYGKFWLNYSQFRLSSTHLSRS